MMGLLQVNVTLDTNWIVMGLFVQVNFHLNFFSQKIQDIFQQYMFEEKYNYFKTQQKQYFVS